MQERKLHKTDSRKKNRKIGGRHFTKEKDPIKNKVQRLFHILYNLDSGTARGLSGKIHKKAKKEEEERTSDCSTMPQRPPHQTLRE